MKMYIPMLRPDFMRGPKNLRTFGNCFKENTGFH